MDFVCAKAEGAVTTQAIKAVALKLIWLEIKKEVDDGVLPYISFYGFGASKFTILFRCQKPSPNTLRFRTG